MRIGIDARFYGALGKGLGRYTEKLIQYLEDADTENEYIIFLRRENFAAYVPKNKRFHKRLAHYAWYSLWEQLFFPLVLYREKLDLVHFPHFNVPLLYAKKFVVTIHDLILLHYPTQEGTTHSRFLYWMKFACYRLVIASAIGRAEKVITVSHYTEGDLLTFYPESQGKVVVTFEATDPYCAWLPPLREEALLCRIGLFSDGLAQEKKISSRAILQPYFLYVGNAYPHKNLGMLLLVAKRFPTFFFVLVGKEDYFYARLKRSATEQGMSNVIFSGFVTDQELGVLYRHAVAYLFPSLYEGFGLPPLEAMQHGLPVIASNQASLPEILGTAALYFHPKNLEDLTQKIQSVIAPGNIRADLRERGYQEVKRFDWGRMAVATRNIYQEILRNQK
jgi:glycosyltransferase involved in cell wall biosynthesis